MNTYVGTWWVGGGFHLTGSRRSDAKPQAIWKRGERILGAVRDGIDTEERGAKVSVLFGLSVSLYRAIVITRLTFITQQYQFAVP